MITNDRFTTISLFKIIDGNLSLIDRSFINSKRLMKEAKQITQLDIIRQKVIKRQRSNADSVAKIRIPSISYENLQNYSSSSNKLPMPTSTPSDITESQSQRVAESSCHWGKIPGDSAKQSRILINKDSFLFRSRLDSKDSLVQVDRKMILRTFRHPKDVQSDLTHSGKPAQKPLVQSWMNIQLPTKQVNSAVSGVTEVPCEKAETSDDTLLLVQRLIEEQVQVFDSKGQRFDKCMHLDQYNDWLASRINRQLTASMSIDNITSELEREIARQKRRRQCLLDRRDELLQKKFEYLDIQNIAPRRQVELQQLAQKQQALDDAETVLGCQWVEDAERLQMIAAYSAARREPSLAELFERAKRLQSAHEA